MSNHFVDVNNAAYYRKAVPKSYEVYVCRPKFGTAVIDKLTFPTVVQEFNGHDVFPKKTLDDIVENARKNGAGNAAKTYMKMKTHFNSVKFTNKNYPFVVCGCCGEFYLLSEDKLLGKEDGLYYFYDDVQVTETSLKERCSINGTQFFDWVKMIYKPKGGIEFAAIPIPKDIKEPINTTQGLVVTNAPGCKHGAGDFIVCPSQGRNEKGNVVPNLRYSTLVNGIKFASIFDNRGWDKYIETPPQNMVSKEKLPKLIDGHTYTGINKLIYQRVVEEFVALATQLNDLGLPITAIGNTGDWKYCKRHITFKKYYVSNLNLVFLNSMSNLSKCIEHEEVPTGNPLEYEIYRFIMEDRPLQIELNDRIEIKENGGYDSDEVSRKEHKVIMKLLLDRREEETKGIYMKAVFSEKVSGIKAEPISRKWCNPKAKELIDHEQKFYAVVINKLCIALKMNPLRIFTSTKFVQDVYAEMKDVLLDNGCPYELSEIKSVLRTKSMSVCKAKIETTDEHYSKYLIINTKAYRQKGKDIVSSFKMTLSFGTTGNHNDYELDTDKLMKEIRKYTTAEEAKKYDIASNLRSTVILYCCNRIVEDMKKEGYLTNLSKYGNIARIIARTSNRYSKFLNLAGNTAQQFGFYTYNNAAEVRAAVAN